MEILKFSVKSDKDWYHDRAVTHRAVTHKITAHIWFAKNRIKYTNKQNKHQ